MVAFPTAFSTASPVYVVYDSYLQRDTTLLFQVRSGERSADFQD